MTYAAGLLACFSCDLEDPVGSVEDRTEATGLLVEHLERRLSLTPLDIVATTIQRAPELKEAGLELFTAYDDFLGLLDDTKSREALDNLEPSKSGNDKLYAKAREIGHRFQDGLNGIFFGEHERIAELTRIYGVF